MLEGKQLILATRPYAQESRRISWFHLLVTLGSLVLAYGVAFSSLVLPIRILASVLIGLLLVRMFMIYHDYLHQAIFRKSLLAKLFFTLYGLLVLAPVSIWKRSHNYHHAHNSKLYTSSIGSFPIVKTDQYLGMSHLERRTYLFIRHPLTILFGYIFAFVWGMCALSFIRNPKKHWDSALALVVHFAAHFWVFTTFGWLTWLLVCLLPCLVSGALGSYLFYAQHNFPGNWFTDKEDWSFSEAALKSSSHMQGGLIMRWFTANIGYHHIHHANSRIPFYRLPEAYAAFPEFQVATQTSLSAADIVSCLRLKTWDANLGRMLTGVELKQQVQNAS